MSPIVIILIVLAVIVLWFMSSYNGLVRLRQMVQEAFSGMDVYMKKRYDLVPNLVESVKAYAKHEEETFAAVTNARSAAMGASGSDDAEVRAKAEGALSGALGRLIAIAEAYPELKANEQFINLQNQLQTLENDIAQSRSYYNGAARQLNTKCETFPTVIIANMFGFKQAKYFELENAAEERQAVKVDFSK